MKHTLTFLSLLIVGELTTSLSKAGDPIPALPSSVAPYTLFNPTPRDQWRDLSPDRPDMTESPITVDAGAWVVEASYFDWTRDRRDDTYTAMATNLKVGLTDRIDFQTVFDAYTWENPAGGAAAEDFSDITLRLKYNLWGNDGGASAFALFPYVKIPTDTALSNGEFEGGLMLPFSMDLTEGIGLGLMAQIDAVHDGLDGYHLGFLHSAVLGFDVTEQFGVYTEYFGIAGPGTYEPYFSVGATYWLSKDLVFDTGGRIGLNDAAEDIGVFSGFTKRF